MSKNMNMDLKLKLSNMTNFIENLNKLKTIIDIVEDLDSLLMNLRMRLEACNQEAPEEQKSSVDEKQVIQTDDLLKTDEIKKVNRVVNVQCDRPKVAPPPAIKSSSEPLLKVVKPGVTKQKEECECGIMVCKSAMSKHIKGVKHSDALREKNRVEEKQALGEELLKSDMDSANITAYMNYMLPVLSSKLRTLGGVLEEGEKLKYLKLEGSRDEIITAIYDIALKGCDRSKFNGVPVKFDKLMNVSKKTNRYTFILNMSTESYKSKLQHVHFIIISKNDEVFLTTYEKKQEIEEVIEKEECNIQ